ncbi:uncharacterized protein [Panulirus ornatus]|uniref:uncharacterized protein n=1 Tax=Panulirus ornatus TaxID=150431 RepID=UPI003A8AC50C
MFMFKVAMVVIMAALAANASLGWRARPAAAAARRPSAAGMWPWHGGPQQRHLQMHNEVRRSPGKPRPPAVPTRASLIMAEAASSLGLPEDLKFYRHLCRTTDVCPYSWRWMEANMLQAIVRWSLLL